MSLFNVLERSHFFFNKSDIIFFLKSGFFQVNNNFVYNIFFNVKLNYTVQIVSNKFIFFYYRFIFNKLNDNLIKLDNYNKLVLKRSDMLLQTFKVLEPKWSKYLLHFYNDIPNFLEIDFFTLTIFVVYKPFFLYDFNYTHVKYIIFFLRNLYKLN